jgi:hypothetical protein
MKSFKEYITESQQWMTNPADGDDFVIELPDEVVCETYIIEVADNCILLDATTEIMQAISEWATLEDTDEGDTGIILDEDQSGMIQLDKSIADAPVKPVANMEEGAMKKEMHQAAERMSLEQFKDRYGDEDWIEDFWRVSNGEPERLDMDEAEYQGRKVPLGKPMRGDVKKFKVYVKDPATGNVKKVNFGHGGTSAKRLGQKTMKIKKSNPARRKSFRARHNCANPGSRTKARYWSCRAW